MSKISIPSQKVVTWRTLSVGTSALDLFEQWISFLDLEMWKGEPTKSNIVLDMLGLSPWVVDNTTPESFKN
jgi:hypothetical protein